MIEEWLLLTLLATKPRLTLDIYKHEEVELQTESQTVEEDTVIIEEVVETLVDEDDLDLLAHLIFAECGSDWCSDDMQRYTASVVLNRMASTHYPNTMREVIWQKGQYACVRNGMIEYEYNDRAYDNALYVLTNGSVLPSNVVFQAQFKQGDGVYEQIGNQYYCYKNWRDE